MFVITALLRENC